MPGTVYSRLLFAEQGFSGSQEVLVPAGYVFVLRDLDVYSDNVDSGNVYLIGSSGQTIWFHGFDLDAGHAYAGWRGRQVVESGAGFALASDLTVDLTLSGYQLTLP